VVNQVEEVSKWTLELTLCLENVEFQKDVISSLRSRLDLLCDEVERAAEDAESSGNKELEDSSAIESNSLF